MVIGRFWMQIVGDLVGLRMFDGFELGCGGGIVAGQLELELVVRERRRKEDRVGDDLRCFMVFDGLGSG